MKKGIITLLVISIMLLVGLTKVNAESYGNALVTYTNCDGGNCNVLVSAPTIYGVTDTLTGGQYNRTTKFHTWNMSATVPQKANTISYLFFGRSQFNNGLDLNISAYITTNLGVTWCDSISYSGNEGYYTISCPIISGTTSINQIAITTVWNFEIATAGQLQQGLSPIINYSYDGTQAIIDNQNQNTQQILEENATYQDTPSKDMTNETQELDNFEQAEQGLINSLDLNMSVMDGITINPNASAYIWQIVERLRQINPAIILLMTSILGMGIIKMVLNR